MKKSERERAFSRGDILPIREKEHNQGLYICNNYRDQISDREFDCINWLCMAYGNNELLDKDLYEEAVTAIRRVRSLHPEAGVE